ncbi:MULTISPECIES: hypothetical protein [Moorena]|uniref:Uncharacterized protein n=1 Tax=Moorena producens 3L TaxID=489825 RepID=F4XZR3_9CYAN|nr:MULTISPECIES: hypothetical protein [Moorena]EGJ29831.1 hypothetical protein LYNGBM3L_58830 [Moorena producens 3L]NEP66741.1 hypothetical protein [Moorena sp. SIO3A5]OLT66390.1 hypothetical protein BI334_16450 [Moorena producens 3L]
MTFAQKNVKAFIKLLKNNPDLLNIQDRQTLEDKIPEDIEEISELLLAWCEQRPEINGALEQVRRSLPDHEPIGEKGIGGTVPTPETKAEYENNVKEELLNALRKSSPPENPEPKNPKG